MKNLLVICFALFLAACARQPVTPPQEGAWDLMAHAPAQNGPYRTQLSLRFGEEGDTRRVTAILWGNNEKELRLDVMAGVGATIGRMLEDPQNFVLYAPRDGKAYVHTGANKPRLRIGSPLPFSLSQLAALLNGHYTEVFGDQPKGMEDNGVYELNQPVGGQLVIGNDGLPKSWRGNGWRMEIAYADNLPSSLKLQSDTGKRAIILVKGRETPSIPFTADNMKLEIPDDVKILPISSYRES